MYLKVRACKDRVGQRRYEEPLQGVVARIVFGLQWWQRERRGRDLRGLHRF